MPERKLVVAARRTCAGAKNRKLSRLARLLDVCGTDKTTCATSSTLDSGISDREGHNQSALLRQPGLMAPRSNATSRSGAVNPRKDTRGERRRGNGTASNIWSHSVRSKVASIREVEGNRSESRGQAIFSRFPFSERQTACAVPPALGKSCRHAHSEALLHLRCIELNHDWGEIRHVVSTQEPNVAEPERTPQSPHQSAVNSGGGSLKNRVEDSAAPFSGRRSAITASII